MIAAGRGVTSTKPGLTKSRKALIMATQTPTTPSRRSAVTSPSRRDILGAGIFTGLTGIAAAAFAKPDVKPAQGAHRGHPSADSELIALCDRCCAMEVEINRIYLRAEDPSGPEQIANETECARLYGASMAVFEQVAAMEPTTPEGKAAYARVALHYASRPDKDGVTIETNAIGEELAWKLVKQLAGGDVVGGQA